MEHVRGSPSPERLVASHAAAADDGGDSWVFGHEQLTRTAYKLVLNASLLEQARKGLNI